MDLGGNIKNLRNSKRISQVEFAKILGISKGAISQIENNVIEPRLALKTKIADFFGVSIADLYATQNERILPVKFLPILKPSEIIVSLNHAQIPPQNNNLVPVVDSDLSKNWFCVMKIVDDSMSPRLSPGNLVILSHDVDKIKTGDLVAIQSCDHSDILIRKFEVINNENVKIKPFNINYDQINLAENKKFKIIAKIVGRIENL